MTTEVFRDPVDAPDYDIIIKYPMYFSKIKEKILKSKYRDKKEFKRDVDLIWDNCCSYNKEGELYDFACHLRSHFNNIWNIHMGIQNAEEARKTIKMLEDSSKLLSSFGKLIKTKFAFPEHPKFEEASKPKKDKSIASRVMDNTLDYKPPSEEKIKTKMTTDEMYKLAYKIDVMPIELLGKVIDILREHPMFDEEKDVVIPLSEIDNKMLREIEAYVYQNSKKEKQVRRMYQDDKINVDEQIENIERELRNVKVRISEKCSKEDSSAVSEVSEGGGDSSYETDDTDDDKD